MMKTSPTKLLAAGIESGTPANEVLDCMSLMGFEPETVAAFTPLPTIAPGEDFQNDCIASGTWQLYPEGTFTPDAQGCWELSSWGMSAQPKGLVLLLTAPQSDQTHALCRMASRQASAGSPRVDRSAT